MFKRATQDNITNCFRHYLQSATAKSYFHACNDCDILCNWSWWLQCDIHTIVCIHEKWTKSWFRTNKAVIVKWNTSVKQLREVPAINKWIFDHAVSLSDFISCYISSFFSKTNYPKITHIFWVIFLFNEVLRSVAKREESWLIRFVNIVCYPVPFKGRNTFTTKTSLL